MEEIFKDIKGFEGKYQISNLGRVKSLNYIYPGNVGFLSPINHHGGYQVVHLSDNGKVYNKTIHTLVAKAFIPQPKGKPIVNHIDGNKHNNEVSNLEWVTYKENTQHAILIGKHDPHHNNIPKGKDNAHSKPILQCEKDGTLVKKWECISDAAIAMLCNPCLLINNARGRTKTARGYVWKYPND